MPKTVTVPEPLEPLFDEAEQLVSEYFAQRVDSPERGRIEVAGERYIMVRTASMSVEFFDRVEHLYQSRGEREAFQVAHGLLYDIAHAMGIADAKCFAERMNLQSAVEKLSAGPIHFAHAGWAYVDIHPESRPRPDDSYYLVYDHPYSFESDAWLRANKVPPGPICAMNAGYSSGWCEHAFGMGLVATEITCKALGHDRCRFIMAPKAAIDRHIAAYLEAHPEIDSKPIATPSPSYIEQRLAEFELREREAQYRAVFEAVTDALLVVERNGVVVQYNPEARKLFGLDLETRPFFIDDLLGIPGFAPEVARAINATGSYAGRTSVPAGDVSGSVRHLELKGSKILHRGQDRLLIVTRDITRRERARLQLQRANVALEERTIELREANKLLTELNQDLVRATEQAVAASRAKSSFLARMSHELRTPLNAVIGYAELIREDTESTGQPANVSDLDNIVSAADHLLQMINEVLDIAKIEAGEMSVSVEPFVLSEFLENVVSVVAPGARKNRNTVDLEIRTEIRRVCTDLIKLRQIALNLMSNAVKFTRDGRVQLIAEIFKRGEDDHLRLTVSDTGIGISEQSLGVLFQPFRQADESTTRRYGGTGLGLAISHSFAALLGGDISVQSQLGHGSTFTLTVPIWILPDRSSSQDEGSGGAARSSDGNPSGTTSSRSASGRLSRM